MTLSNTELDTELKSEAGLDSNYPFIVQGVMEYIKEIKANDKEIALVDIILDYCFRNNLEIELVGDAISSDLYFKNFIEKDCEFHRMIISENDNEIDEW